MSHINKDGQFQSDKYEWCKPDFVPLKVTDKSAQPFLWGYAQVRRKVDAEFADDLEKRLVAAGHIPEWWKESLELAFCRSRVDQWFAPSEEHCLITHKVIIRDVRGRYQLTKFGREILRG